jgi:hypothetical protein
MRTAASACACTDSILEFFWASARANCWPATEHTPWAGSDPWLAVRQLAMLQSGAVHQHQQQAGMICCPGLHPVVLPGAVRSSQALVNKPLPRRRTCAKPQHRSARAGQTRDTRCMRSTRASLQVLGMRAVRQARHRSTSPPVHRLGIRLTDCSHPSQNRGGISTRQLNVPPSSRLPHAAAHRVTRHWGKADAVERLIGATDTVWIQAGTEKPCPGLATKTRRLCKCCGNKQTQNTTHTLSHTVMPQRKAMCLRWFPAHRCS